MEWIVVSNYRDALLYVYYSREKSTRVTTAISRYERDLRNQIRDEGHEARLSSRHKANTRSAKNIKRKDR